MIGIVILLLLVVIYSVLGRTSSSDSVQCSGT